MTNQQLWIRTTECLPKLDTDVVALMFWSEAQVGRLIEDKETSEIIWRFKDYNVPPEAMDDVMYWLPLPEFPKLDLSELNN